VTTATLNVPDISCDHCKSSIESAVSPIDGVETVEVNVDARAVDVAYDGTRVTFDAIVSAIEDQGYDIPDRG
jgi:copper chaperone